MENLIKIEGDASFRKFFRKKRKNYSSIVVYTRKDKLKNLLIYDAINKIFIKNKILAPNLYKENYSKNYIEIQDFGNETIYKHLKKREKNKYNNFKKVINLLLQIQKIKNRKVKNFKNKNYVVPKYEKKILIDEANLFNDWYAKKKLSNLEQNRFSKEYKNIIKKLALNLRQKNDTFVHRDFHVSNLMLVKNRIGIIDSQDALIGNKAYDLASLIDDVRFKTSKSMKKKIYNFYFNKNKKLKVNEFKNDFEILSVMRNLKIIGIFSRLAIRDKKKKYLKMIPYSWELINMRINENAIFQDLKNLLNRYFKKRLYEN